MTMQELKTRIEVIKKQKANDIYICDHCQQEVDGWDVEYFNHQFLCIECSFRLQEAQYVI